MTKVETETGQMIKALRDGLHGLHLARMALVAEARALRLAGRRAERDKVWARVEEITAQIEVSTKELDDHMLRSEKETQRRGDAEARWTDLIPCPFCGGGAQHAFGMDEHWVLCTVCGASGKIANTRQHAVDAWNTRTAYLPDDHNADSKPKTKKRQPVTQRDAAKLCGVTEKTIRRWEKGKGTPSRYPGRGDALTLRFWAEGNRQAANIKRAVVRTGSGSDGAD